MRQHIAIYVRVSTDRQNTAMQEVDLQRWAEANANGTPVLWYRDKATGKTMDRPDWQRLESARLKTFVSTIVVWRLDRLGRTASGLTKLFDELETRERTW